MALLTTKRVCELRSGLKACVRTFFAKHNYIEVDTPVAVRCPGTEVHLGFWETEWRSLGARREKLFLRSSPELHMKQLLADGVSRCFQLAPCFRNDGEFGPWHRPEFTMLEFYEAGCGYQPFINRTEEFFRDVLAQMRERFPSEVNFTLPSPIPRVSVFDAFAEHTGVTLIDGDTDLAGKLRAAGLHSVRAEDDFETAYFKGLLERVEPGLEKYGALFLFDFPASQAALARVANGRAERFELYCGRVELCNAFHELTDARLNEERIAEAFALRRALGKAVPNSDPDFLAAVKKGMPPSSGNAVGFDRLLAIFLALDSLEPIMPVGMSFYDSESR